MHAWRLVRTEMQDTPLSAEGARRWGGRWNPRDHGVLYASETLSLAALEVLAHLPSAHHQPRYTAVHLTFPDDVQTWSVGELPANWRSTSLNPDCQARGQAWITAGNTLAVRVPSVIVPMEMNVLLNPVHPRFADVKVTESFPFSFDPRLLKGK